MSNTFLKKKSRENGFVAIMATIIISLVLLASTLSVSRNSFYMRSNVLNREFKKTSFTLAESCVYKTLQKLSIDYFYIPTKGGEDILVGSDSCRIRKVVHSIENTNTRIKSVTIEASAQSGGAHTNLIVTADIRSPFVQTTFFSPYVTSFLEVSRFP